jgi:hypothetical protein
MINHARTVLLNAPPTSRPAIGVDGEEYVPPGFVALRLTKHMAVVHAVMFGSAPDSGFQNAMLAQYMNALHTVDSAERYILGLDSRTTYRRSGYLVPDGSVEVVRLSGTTTLMMDGAPAADAARGATLWFIRVSRDRGRMTLRNLVTNGARTVDGNAVDFSGVTFRAAGDGAWDVKVRAAPSWTVVDVLNALDARKAEFADLWREARPEFYAWWARGQTPMIRISGVLCAFVEATERIRHG